MGLGYIDYSIILTVSQQQKDGIDHIKRLGRARSSSSSTIIVSPCRARVALIYHHASRVLYDAAPSTRKTLYKTLSYPIIQRQLL